MKVNVLAFAGLKDALGKQAVQLELASDTCVSDAIEALIIMHPQVKPIASVLCCAIDQEYAALQDRLTEGCELALFTPVGGG